jgi:putative peptidoglycan lipid II flippase
MVIATFGAGVENDSLIASATLSQVMLAILANSVIQVATPIFAKAEDAASFRKLLMTVSTIVMMGFASLSVLMFVSKGYWSAALFKKLFESDRETFENLVAINTLGMFLTGMTAVQTAAYYATHRFERAESIAAGGSFLSLGVMIFTIGKLGIYAAALPAIVKPLFQIILMRDSLQFCALNKLDCASARNFLTKLKPLVFGNSYLKLDPVVDRYILTKAETGSLTLVSLTQQVYGAISQIVHKALIGTILSEAAAVSKDRHPQELKILLIRKLITVGICIFVAGIIVLSLVLNISLFSIPLKTLSEGQLRDFGWIILCLFGMFAGGLLGGVTSSFFYAIGDTKTPTLMSIITFTIYVPVKFFVFESFGVIGFCLAASAYLLINFLIMMYLLSRLHFDKGM